MQPQVVNLNFIKDVDLYYLGFQLECLGIPRFKLARWIFLHEHAHIS